MKKKLEEFEYSKDRELAMIELYGEDWRTKIVKKKEPIKGQKTITRYMEK